MKDNNSVERGEVNVTTPQWLSAKIEYFFCVFITINYTTLAPVHGPAVVSYLNFPPRPPLSRSLPDLPLDPALPPPLLAPNPPPRLLERDPVPTRPTWPPPPLAPPRAFPRAPPLPPRRFPLEPRPNVPLGFFSSMLISWLPILIGWIKRKQHQQNKDYLVILRFWVSMVWCCNELHDWTGYYEVVQGIGQTCPQVEPKFFSSATRERQIFYVYCSVKASEKAGIRLVSPAENRIKWRHFGVSYLRPRRMQDWAELGPTTGTGNEKKRTLRKTRNWVKIRPPKTVP